MTNALSAQQQKTLADFSKLSEDSKRLLAAFAAGMVAAAELASKQGA